LRHHGPAKPRPDAKQSVFDHSILEIATVVGSQSATLGGVIGNDAYLCSQNADADPDFRELRERSDNHAGIAIYKLAAKFPTSITSPIASFMATPAALAAQASAAPNGTVDLSPFASSSTRRRQNMHPANKT
jgi:hypothetical protein